MNLHDIIQGYQILLDKRLEGESGQVFKGLAKAAPVA